MQLRHMSAVTALVRSVFSRFPGQIAILHRRNRFGRSHRSRVQLIRLPA